MITCIQKKKKKKRKMTGNEEEDLDQGTMISRHRQMGWKYSIKVGLMMYFQIEWINEHLAALDKVYSVYSFFS